MDRDHGSPYYHVHRADFHRLLFDLVADTKNVTVRLNATVTRLDSNGKDARPSVTLSSGEVVYGDLIIGADGVKSMIRQVPFFTLIAYLFLILFRYFVNSCSGCHRSTRSRHSYG